MFKTVCLGRVGETEAGGKCMSVLACVQQTTTDTNGIPWTPAAEGTARSLFAFHSQEESRKY